MLSTAPPGTPGAGPPDCEKRIRREIANSNERRRMQSINVGYQCLKSLLPHHKGEKLSKAGILQQTSEYVQMLEKEKTQLLIQNTQLRQKLKEVSPASLEGISPPPKRKKRETEPSDEGIGLGFDLDAATAGDLLELRRQLERERRQRLFLETRIHNLEAQVGGEVEPGAPAAVVAVTSAPVVQPQQQQQPPPAAIIIKHPAIVSPPAVVVSAASAVSRMAPKVEPQRMDSEVMEISPPAHTVTKPAASLPPTTIIIKEESNVAMQTPQHPPSPNYPPPTAGVLVAKSAPIDVPRGVRGSSHRVGVSGPPAAAPPRQPAGEFTSPQSKRNLEMIVEAICHLEGETFGQSDDDAAMDSQPANQNHPDYQNNNHLRAHIPRALVARRNQGSCEESQTESSPSNSDQEDYYSAGPVPMVMAGSSGSNSSSGTESPLSLSNPETNNVNVNNSGVNSRLIRAAATLCVTPGNQVNATTAAISNQRLVTPSIQMPIIAGFFRPGVIIHKSS